MTEIFPIDILKRGVKVVIGKKEELFSEAEKNNFLEAVKKDYDECASKSAMITFFCPTGDSIIYSSFVPNTDAEKWILAHECLHAISHMLRSIDIEHTDKTEEVYAYTLEYLGREISSWLSSESPSPSSPDAC